MSRYQARCTKCPYRSALRINPDDVDALGTSHIDNMESRGDHRHQIMVHFLTEGEMVLIDIEPRGD